MRIKGYIARLVGAAVNDVHIFRGLVKRHGFEPRCGHNICNDQVDVVRRNGRNKTEAEQGTKLHREDLPADGA